MGATLAALAGHYAVSYAAYGQLNLPVVGVGVLFAALALAGVFVHIGTLTRQRRRQALVEHLAAALSVPSTIAEAGRAAATLLTEAGLAEAGVVAVADAEPEAGARGTEDAALPVRAVAVAGFPRSVQDGEVTLEPGLASEGITVRDEPIALIPLLRPLADRLGERAWVARLPLIRGDETLGVLLLVARRPGALRDRGLLEVTASLVATALDHARLYQAAFLQAQEMEQQERRRRDFLYAISHELRTPLTSIQAFADLLAETPANSPDENDLVASLTRGVARLQDLVDDLLQLGRLETVGQDVAARAIEVGDVLRGAASMLQPSFLNRQQVLTLQLPHESTWAVGDERALEHVLVNILSNANRHTPQGGSVSARILSEDEHVRIEIDDSGPGIAAQDRKRIFEPFYRVVRTGAPQVPGSGLGLAVARRFAEAQHGRLWVEEAPGGGSRFCLELPAVPQTSRASGPTATAAEPAVANVEDESTITPEQLELPDAPDLAPPPPATSAAFPLRPASPGDVRS